MTAPHGRGRARDLGIRLGLLDPGPLNAITDVAGVRVGHATVILDEPPGRPLEAAARTGVTAIWPGDRLGAGAVPAGGHALNGSGEVTGMEEIRELGRIDTPILLTNTMGVGVAYDAACRYLIAADPERMPEDEVAIPIVGECNDAFLNDAHGMHVTADEVVTALDAATGGPVAEGCVGAGTGMICYLFKGGIGTSSRRLDPAFGGYTVGALALTNFGDRPFLTIGGYPVGQRYPWPRPRGLFREPERGSCIVVLATDAPLTSKQLDRVAQRAGLGLARTGSYAGNGSGEIFVAFSTAYRLAAEGSLTYPVDLVRDTYIDPIFAAAVEATEEAVVNSLCMATTTTGHRGRTIEAMPLDWIAEAFPAR